MTARKARMPQGVSREAHDTFQPRTAMQLDDELCLCFHVTRRKVAKFLSLEKPGRASQLAGCFGAGTGCGWCRPYLQRMFDSAQRSAARSEDVNSPCDLPEAAEYGRDRRAYIVSGKGQPPS
jgi:NAD(P)H-nitrite reductase large subunit